MKEFLNENKLWIKIIIMCCCIYIVLNYILPMIGIDLSSMYLKMDGNKYKKLQIVQDSTQIIKLGNIPLIGTITGIIILTAKALKKLIEW